VNRSLMFDLAAGAFIPKREDTLFLGPGGTGKSHLAQAIGQAAILQGYKVLYRELHVLLDELSDAVAEGTRKEYIDLVSTIPLLILDDFGMRKLPHTSRRRSVGDCDAPLRTLQHTAHFESPG
jgi:DNA replication protein DnaC